MAGENAARVLSRLGDRWKGLVNTAADLERVRPEGTDRFGFLPGGEDRRAAEQLKRKFLAAYRGRAIGDVFGGGEVSLDGASCYRIESTCPLDLHMIGSATARGRLLADLKLLYGIGRVTEQSLKEAGYATIGDLTRHPRYNGEAQTFLALLGEGDAGRLADWIRRWFSGSDPLAFYLSSFHDPQDLVLIDIETLGLSPDRPVILAGAARLAGAEVAVSQYLVREAAEETAVLKMLCARVAAGTGLVTFNGKSFDIPYVKGRMAYYRLRGDLDRPHYDLYHFARRAWRDEVPDHRLGTLEKHLFHTARRDDVPSELVPAFYRTYQETGNIGPLVPIIEHNRQDLVTLARLFARLHEEWR